MGGARGGTAALAWRAAVGAVGVLAIGPVLAGLAGIVAPAFGWLPVLGHERLSLEPVRALLDAPGFWRSALLSAGVGLAATLVSVALTVLLLAATFETRALAAVERLLAPLLSVPHAAAALGFAFLFAPSGYVFRLFAPVAGWEAPPDLVILRDPWGLSLMAALVLKEVPFLFLLALAALPQVRAVERVRLTRTLGYGRVAAFVHGVWPLLYRQMRLPVLAVLAFSASVVDVALILGPTRPAPLAVRVTEWLGRAGLDGWLVGSAGALAVALLVGGLVLLWFGLERVAAGATAVVRQGGRRFARDGMVRAVVLGGAFAAAALAFAGFGGLMVQSVAGWWPFPELAPGTVSLAAWEARLPMAAGTLRDTAVVALGATALALPLAVLIVEGERRGVRLGALLYVPLVAPQVAFLFGLNVLFLSVGIPGSLGLVTAVHALFALPYAVIALSGPWAALDGRYEQVAAAAGVRPWRRFFAVRVPLMTGPLLVAAALSVAVSVGLYLPTLVIGGGRVVTVITEAVAAASGGDRRLVGIFATLQLALPLVAFGLARGVPAVLFRHRRGMRGGRAA